MSTLHGSLLPFFKLRLSWGVTQLETGFRRSSNTNGRVGPDDTITLFSMNTSANMFGGVAAAVLGGVGSRLSALQGRRQGFCVRWDGVNRQIGSLLYVSSLRFHAGWIYRESQCTGMCRGLLGGRYHRARARSCELHMMDWWWKEVNIFYCLLK